ncbi:MAG: biotin synthase BioB [Chlamydiae bacterium]|nr:biotin synthase BioB [Chlamydiota bacterium]
MKKTWTYDKAKTLFDLPFNDLLYKAHTVYRKNFNSNAIQISTLLNIKKGGCSEDCAYCSQSARHKGSVEPKRRVDLNTVREAAKQAKLLNCSRLCMGAAWRSPTEPDMDAICEMIQIVKSYGLESCVTLGFLNEEQTNKLKNAGLDYYNHNIETSPSYYEKIVTTHSFEDRLKTLEYVRNAGIKICCGGILGMGEANEDRIRMLVVLTNLPSHPQSVPINKLIPMPNTPLEMVPEMDAFDFIKTIALARILLPLSDVRLSAGRSTMSDEMQALCFFAGANSIFYGDTLLTAKNQSMQQDEILFNRLGLKKR